MRAGGWCRSYCDTISQQYRDSQKLGGKEVVDYQSPTDTDETRKILVGRSSVGAFDEISSSKTSYKLSAAAIQNATQNRYVVSTADEIEEGG